MNIKRCAAAVVLCALLAAGCAAFVKPPADQPKGDGVVALLFDESDFKNRVAAGVTMALEGEGVRVTTDRLKRAKYYDAADYGAVVYFADLWAWHTPWHAVRYWKANGKARNIVFVVTAGDPDAKITEPFDAVTSASDPAKADAVVSEIAARVGDVL